jgi:hypothetical protein
MDVKKQQGLIQQAWAKTEETLSKDQQNRRLNTMRRNAENQLSSYLTTKEDKEAALQQLIESSKQKEVAFSDICDAYMAAEEAKLAYEEFVQLYTKLFGESPLLVS